MGSDSLYTWQSDLEKGNEETGSAWRVRFGRYYTEIEAPTVNLRARVRMENGI